MWYTCSVSAPPALALLEAQDFATGDVAPTSAFVHVTLASDRFFSGNAAFTQAEELRRLATALATRGVPETALALEGAAVDVASGVFSKSSSVTYRVRILVEDLERLPGVLDAVSEAKKASLTSVAWNYDDNTVAMHALLRKAGQRAAAKAKVLAEAVGATLGALHSVREVQGTEPSRSAQVAPPFAAPARARSESVADQLSGLELAPKKRLTLRVVVVFTLASGPEGSAAPAP